jgi:ABC-type branched-subunit amino acid transport system substrate-binding protein
LHEVNPGLPPELSALVMKMLAKKPEDRPASAEEIVDLLEAIAPTLPALPQLPRSGGRKPAADGPPQGKVTPIAGVSTRAQTTPLAGSATKGRSTPVAGVPVVQPTEPRRRNWLFAGLSALAGVLVVGSLLAFWRGWFFSSGPDSSERHDATDQKTFAPVQGVTADEIMFGMSAPFSGPSRELGRPLEIGIRTYFNHINDQGGIAGRKLKLVALDDGYEPDRALANIKDLAEHRKVFAMIGNVGTPTAAVTVPYALEKKLLFFGAYSGADLLRKHPPDRYVFNVRASYEEETAAVVRYLIETEKIRPEQIAVFAQQDSYGDSGFRGVVKVLRKYGRDSSQILRVSYPRNTLKIDEAVNKIVQHKEVRAVVMVPTYRPAARFIQKVKDARKDITFTCTSFVNSEALAEELRQLGEDYAEGVIITEVVPPFDSDATVVLQYRDLLREYFPSEKPGFASLEGFLDAVVLVEGLRRAGTNLSTEQLVDALELIRERDLGLGAPITYGKSEHQALHKVWAIQFDKDGGRRALDLE